MSAEVSSYRLTLRGKPVGTQVMHAQLRTGSVALTNKTMLQGSLGQHTISQTSRLNRNSLHSMFFSELKSSRSEKSRYEVKFDLRDGLVKASKGKDTATIPYYLPYQDPLGLLYQLRQIKVDVPVEHRDEDTLEMQPLHIPMLGKDVTVESLGVTKLETALGEKEARVFRLFPGWGYAYVDLEAPHHLLKLSQKVEGQFLEALLVKVSQEPTMPIYDDVLQQKENWNKKRRGGKGGKSGGKNNRRRRPNRRR